MENSAIMLPGERVLWSGEPGRGVYLTGYDVFLIPFSLMWCGFAIFWMVSVTSMGGSADFKIFGAVFVLMGLYVVFGRFLADMWLRSGTSYMVTNRRVLINRGGFFVRQTAVSLADLPPVSLRLRRSGRGTIRFGEVVGIWGRGNGLGAWSPSSDPTPQFILIENAQNVFDMINRARDDLLRSAGPGAV